jgi:hypothetical protein
MIDKEKEERLKQFEHQKTAFAIMESQNKADKDYMTQTNSGNLLPGRLSNLGMSSELPPNERGGMYQLIQMIQKITFIYGE